ncbi:hypothetical protein WJ70_22375 [Burkholderia ubonensis]|nr:hypothetical protein WJ70_22375 [Burkholderia ubonensis]
MPLRAFGTLAAIARHRTFVPGLVAFARQIVSNPLVVACATGIAMQAGGAIAYLGAVGTVVAFVWYSQGIRALGPALQCSPISCRCSGSCCPWSRSANR